VVVPGQHGKLVLTELRECVLRKYLWARRDLNPHVLSDTRT
jgi:hypothetical protein